MSFSLTFSRCEEGEKVGATEGEIFFMGERGNKLLRMDQSTPVHVCIEDN